MTSESLDVNRRLTCILAADAVGYSRMMSADEEGTIRILNGHREIIDSIIAAHGGRIVGTAGDSVLAEFGSAVGAVRCATEMQEALKTRNEKLPEGQRMLFRVGVNLGDVVVKGSDILGDGVNVAARLESIAEPGGVCIASSVYDQITGKLDLGFVDIGEQQLKNISRPIRAYQIGGVRAALPLTAHAASIAPAPVAGERKGSPWLAISLAVVGVLAIGLAVLGGIAWDRGWVGARSSPSRDTVVVRKTEAPVVAVTPPPKPAPPIENPRPVQKPAVDPTFAALAAGEAVSQSPTATFTCAGSSQPYASRATLRDGEIILETSAGRSQGYWRVSGRPQRDNLALRGNFISASGRAEEAARFEGRRAAGRFLLDGNLGSRNCSVTIAGL